LTRIAANTASVRLIGKAAASEDLRREIDNALADAAPDLDEVTIDWQETRDDMPVAAVAD
jgi:hypothetical protein